jgi:DNA-binding GntR family transcriptional regulator
MLEPTVPLSGAAGETLAEAAYRSIQEMIVTRRLPPGTMVSENQLSEELGCGRTPIREALQRLKLEGFVEIHPRRGVLVAPVDVVRQLELLEVRRALELLVVRLAAERASPRERSAMRRLAEEIRAAAAVADPIRYLRATQAIHEAEAEATHNPVLAQAIGVIHSLSRRFWYAHIEDMGGFPEASEIHAATLDSISRGEAAEAMVHVQRLHDYLERLTRSALERRSLR